MLKYEDLRIAYLEEEKKVLDEELYFSQQTHNNYVNVDSEELHQKAENYAEQLNVKGVDQAEPESNAKRGELLDMMQFMDKDFPEDEIIVETLLQERGVTILAGDSGVGKSYIGLEFAFCIAHGKPVFQHFKVDKPRKVRIYQFELTKSQLQKRLGQLKKNYGSTNKITLKHYEHRRLFQDRWKEIEQDLMNNGLNGGVLIIDNFYTSLDGDADPSVNKLLIPYIDKMTELADKFDVAILLINHHYKGVLDKPISADHIIGGKYLQMASSYIIQVKDSRRSADLRYAMITKTRDEYSELENKPWKLRWNPDEHIWTKEEMIKNEQAHLFEPSERWELGVVQSMKQYEDSGNNPKKGGEWTRELIWNHIQATLDWARNKSNENKVTRLIKRLCDWGAIKKQAHNTYVILDNELTLGE